MDRRQLSTQLFVIVVLVCLVNVCLSLDWDVQEAPERSCPAVCTCDETLQSVDCSHRGLVKPPKHMAPESRIINLAGNRLVHLTNASFVDTSAIVELDLSSNLIYHLPEDIFAYMHQLAVLNLGNNRLEEIPVAALSSLTALRRLVLARNQITSLSWHDTFHPGSLQWLDLSSNRITIVDRLAHTIFPNLTTLYLNDNPIVHIVQDSFSSAPNMRFLSLCQLNSLTSIDDRSLRGLLLLEMLNISECSRLSHIHWGAFADLKNLKMLDMRYNQLRTISHKLFTNLNDMVKVRLSGNPWHCDCRLKLLRDELELSTRKIGDDIICSSPPSARDLSLLDMSFSMVDCNQTDYGSEPFGTKLVYAVQLNRDIILDCASAKLNVDSLMWAFGEGKTVEGKLLEQLETAESSINSLSLKHGVYVETTSNLDEFESARIKLLSNGSLLIQSAMRHDTGYYYCTVSNSVGEFMSTVELRLDYTIMASIMGTSFVIGFFSAAAFFCFAAIMGLIRYLSHVCSDEERMKRRSLRDVLAQIRNGAHVDRISAYRTAKLDQFAAFKSATMDQLSSFKTDRIDRLRKYKQATVSAVLHQLERMREHYAAQAARIKDSYTQNVEKLRENYALQRSRFQDRRSVSVQHIRKQYQARAERTREYSMAQVARLREQYQQQQQYFLKLLELIDVGSCVSQAVEVECMRAESAIFDAGAIAFDEEARPSHAVRDEDFLLFDTASLPDGFPVLNDSAPELFSTDIVTDDDMDDYLPPLDVHIRSLSTSNLGDGHLLISSGNVLFHRSCEAEPEAIGAWKKSESTPAMCVVPESACDVAVVDTVL